MPALSAICICKRPRISRSRTCFSSTAHGRRGCAGLGKLRPHLTELLIELGTHDDVVVYDGDDTVDFLNTACLLRVGSGATQEQDQQDDKMHERAPTPATLQRVMRDHNDPRRLRRYFDGRTLERVLVTGDVLL